MFRGCLRFFMETSMPVRNLYFKSVGWAVCSLVNELQSPVPNLVFFLYKKAPLRSTSNPNTQWCKQVVLKCTIHLNSNELASDSPKHKMDHHVSVLSHLDPIDWPHTSQRDCASGTCSSKKQLHPGCLYNPPAYILNTHINHLKQHTLTKSAQLHDV